MWEDDDSLWAGYDEIDDMEQYEIDCLREDARLDRECEPGWEESEDEDDDLEI